MVANLGLDPVTRETVSGRVYRDLRNLIMAGQVSPGERLSIRALASVLGTSVMPVRDAVSRLAAERALEVLPSRAVRVPPMTPLRFQELREIRVLLEGHATELAARLLSPAGVVRLQEIHASFEAEHESRDPDGCALVRLNKEFHFHLYEAAAMPSLLSIIEGLWLQVGAVLNYDLRSSSRRTAGGAALRFHRDLVNAVAHGDAPAARAALVGDITAAGDYILGCGALLVGSPESPALSD